VPSSRVRPKKSIVVALFVLAAVACRGGSHGPRPEASLASTITASTTWAEIQLKWDAYDGTPPGVLRADLERYITTFPDDGRVPLARAYLACQMMDQGDWAGADKMLDLLRSVPPGTTEDLVTIASARMLRHGSQPDAALDSLRPLVGKVVDATIREYFLEEITSDALAAHREFEAIAYMDAWLRGIGEDKRDRVRAKVASSLAKIPDDVLEQTYRAIRSNRGVLGYGADIQRLVAERLAQSAIASGDPKLARWLLDPDAGPAYVGGDAGLLLGDLATSKRGIVTVTGRTVGLLLPTASVDLRDEAADVARGVAWALELPRSDPAKGDGTRLVTRDDGGDPNRTEIALEELAGEGAAVILAAVDAATADRAITWAEAHKMPLLALAPPSLSRPLSWSFVLGQSRDEELGALADDLAARNMAKAAVVASAPTPILEGRGFPLFLPLAPCNVELARAGEPRFPLADWEKQGVRGVLVAGPVECARDVVRELGLGRKPITVALTLDAGSTTARASNVTILGVQVGVIPVLATRPEAVADPDVRAYMSQFGARPSVWTALGRDGGALARAAVSVLPMDTTSDPIAIGQRRSLVQSRIATTKTRLWTSEGDGFASAHALKRTLRVVELPK
jgi:hypothetical protein